MRSYRLGLRLFLLLCVAASLLLGWLGVMSNLRSMEAALSGKKGGWEQFGKASNIGLGASGEVTRADIHNGSDMDLLLVRHDCSTIEYLGIYAPEALQRFQPEEFQSVKQLNLANVGLTNAQLAKLGALANLEKLVFTQERDEDLSLEWKGLAQIPKLKYLILSVGAEVSFSEFPDLKELRTITLNSPEVTTEQETTLQQRVPNCTLISRSGRYQTLQALQPVRARIGHE